VEWHEGYLGKPWAARPEPPASYNCAVLCASVYRDVFGIEVGEITRDGSDLTDCVTGLGEAAGNPGIWGLDRLPEGAAKREFDCVFMARVRYDDHCGIAVRTADGMLIMHCLQTGGVVLDAPIDLLARGFSRLTWFRRRGLEWAGRIT
jgi:hypothetical protein